MHQRSRRSPVAITSADFTSPPVGDKDGAAIPVTYGAMRPAKLLLEIFATGASTATGPIIVWAYNGQRWNVAGVINDGLSIDAEAGLEELLEWHGAERIALSVAAIVGTVPTVQYSIIDERQEVRS